MKTTVSRLVSVFFGVALMAATASFAVDSKCGAGKCGGDMGAKKTHKNMDSKCGAGKCGGDMGAKKMLKDAKCGAGKCGGDTGSKKAKTRCGAGKCGG